MDTIVIQIGNSDNKLSQKQYSEFITDVREALTIAYDLQVHFDGSSPGDRPWQNHCFIVTNDLDTVNTAKLLRTLTIIRETYVQDSMAILQGYTRFI